MEHNISAKRKNDAVITVCQDNDKREIVVEAFNRAAEKLTGYVEREMRMKNFSQLLPAHIQEALESDLEYGNSGNDLADIIRKIRHFEIINKSGQEIPVSLKVFYVVSSHMDKPEFELLLRDVSVLQKIEELRVRVMQATNDSGHLNHQIGIPDKEVMMTTLELIHQFVVQHGVEASLATIEIDHILDYKQQYGVDVATDIAKHICRVMEDSLREGDSVGYLGDGVFAVSLLDCNEEDAKIVLNRLRMMVESAIIESKHLQKRIVTSLSIGFREIFPEDSIEQTLDACKQALGSAKSAGGNTIYTL